MGNNMSISQKFNQFMNKPRKSTILANANHLVYGKGMLWAYLTTVSVLAFWLLYATVLICVIFNQKLALIVTTITLLCVYYVMGKIYKYKDALKDSTAYEMLYKKKTFDTEFKQIIEESDYNGNRRISDNDRHPEDDQTSGTATSSTNAGIERELTAVGRVIERRNRQRK